MTNTEFRYIGLSTLDPDRSRSSLPVSPPDRQCQRADWARLPTTTLRFYARGSSQERPLLEGLDEHTASPEDTDWTQFGRFRCSGSARPHWWGVKDLNLGPTA